MLDKFKINRRVILNSKENLGAKLMTKQSKFKWRKVKIIKILKIKYTE